MFGQKMRTTGLVKTSVVTTIAAATLFAPLAGDAFARENRASRRTSQVARVQQECGHQIGRVDRDFTNLTNAIIASVHLTGPHKAVLGGSVGADHAALNDARVRLNAAVTFDAARAACRDALARNNNLRFDIRKARLTSKADRIDTAIADMQTQIDEVAALVDQFEADGNDVTDLRTALGELQASLDQLVEGDANLGDSLAALLAGDGASATLLASATTLNDGFQQLAGLTETIDGLNATLTPAPGGAPGVN